MALSISLFLHILAAIFWIGGMLFLSLVVRPFLNTIEDEKKRSEIYQVVGAGFRFWGWVAIALLLVTGPLNLYLMGIPPASIFDPEFIRSGYGFKLALKLVLVFIILVSSVFHDFLFGPGAGRAGREGRAGGAGRYRALAKYLGRTNLVIALFIVLLGVLLRLHWR